MSEPDRWLTDARAGDPVAWGRLLEFHRPYLRLVARVQMGRRLQIKADPEDLVQEAFLQAQRKFPDFRGQTANEFAAWLEEVLASRLAKHARRYLATGARDLRLEQDIRNGFVDSTRYLEGLLVDTATGPLTAVGRREQTVALARALDRLAEDHRRVLILRHLEGRTFPEVAAQMDRSVGAVTQLWARAVVRLREILQEAP